MTSIDRIHARQVFDSRGNPTVECEVTTNKGTFRAIVPSGASTGHYEAVELRDGVKTDYLGKGVSKALENVNQTIFKAIQGQSLDVTQQEQVDNFLLQLDGTENKSKLGANAILGVSLAVAKAGAAAKGVPLYRHLANLAGIKEATTLPVPAFNVINGGSHAGNRFAWQEIFVIPTGAKNFGEAMKIGTEIYHNLKSIIKKKYGIDATNVGDEGGFAPNIQSVEDALDLLVEAIAVAKYTDKVKLGLDVAASEFYKEKERKYDLDFKNPNSDKSKWLSGQELTDYYLRLLKNYPIATIEDPFDQDDWESWSLLTAKAGIQIVGDDLTVTNVKRIKTAVEKKSCNALLLKVNQIGSVTESIKAALLARDSSWGCMVSHRSGETEDTFISHLAVALSNGQIKAGAPTRSERLAKYNELLRIEEELGGSAKYAGENFRRW